MQQKEILEKGFINVITQKGPISKTIKNGEVDNGDHNWN
jgi:hypothetical protein